MPGGRRRRGGRRHARGAGRCPRAHLRTVPLDPLHTGERPQAAHVQVSVGEAHRGDAAEALDDRGGRAVGHDPTRGRARRCGRKAARLPPRRGSPGRRSCRRRGCGARHPTCAGARPGRGSGELVEEHELGAADEGERHEQPLALAARQRGERAPPQVVELPLVGQSSSGWGAGCSDANSASASPTRMRSGRAASWSCEPIRRRSRSPALCGSSPRTDTVPLSARRNPCRISTVVVLPAPLVPRRPNSSPRRTENEIPRRPP